MEQSPNEVLTMIYLEDEVVYVPVIVSYMGDVGIRAYLDSEKLL